MQFGGLFSPTFVTGLLVTKHPFDYAENMFHFCPNGRFFSLAPPNLPF
jgi:hypothetical protein